MLICTRQSQKPALKDKYSSVVHYDRPAERSTDKWSTQVRTDGRRRSLVRSLDKSRDPSLETYRKPSTQGEVSRGLKPHQDTRPGTRLLLSIRRHIRRLENMFPLVRYLRFYDLYT